MPSAFLSLSCAFRKWAPTLCSYHRNRVFGDHTAEIGSAFSKVRFGDRNHGNNQAMFKRQVGDDVTETGAFLVKVLKVRQNQGQVEVRTFRQFDSCVRAGIRAKNVKPAEALTIKGLESFVKRGEDGPNSALSPLRYLPDAGFERPESAGERGPGGIAIESFQRGGESPHLMRQANQRGGKEEFLAAGELSLQALQS